MMFDIKIYVVGTLDMVSISTSCSHPVNRGQLGNETWCFPVILTVEDMIFLQWCWLVFWDVTFYG